MKLELRNINKSFSGKHILKDVSFVANGGTPLGFLGRNGAGKTTTMRTIMEVFRQDSGEILIDGKPYRRYDYKIGYMPEERGMYQEIEILDQLSYIGQLKGMKKKAADESAANWIHRFDLDEYKNKKLSTLSKGNQQKIQIAQAVIDDPDILILDEPFSGLDPVNAQSLANVIIEYVDKGRIVIFSSHQMASVEEFCDDIVLINKGEIVLNDSLKNIKRLMGMGKKRLRVTGFTQDDVKNYLEKFGDFKVENDRISSIIDFNSYSGNIGEIISGIGKNIELFSDYEPSLNDIFIKKVGEYENE